MKDFLLLIQCLSEFFANHQAVTGFDFSLDNRVDALRVRAMTFDDGVKQTRSMQMMVSRREFKSMSDKSAMIDHLMDVFTKELSL